MSTVPATPNIPMQAAPWRRALVRSLWKELRAVRPLAIGVFVLAAITSVALGELLEFHYNTAIGNQARLWGVVAFFAAALHAVGAAAALLAGEREDGADQFYEAVVAPPATIYAAKVLAIVASSAGIVAAMWLAATVLGNSGALRAFALMGGDGGVWMVWLGLVWGVLAALLCPQPLLAAVLGIALASIASHLLVEAAYHLSRGRISSHYLDGIWLYLPATLAVFVLDARLGVRWATPGRTARRAWRRRNSVATGREDEAAACHGSVSRAVDATSSDALTAHRAVARAGAAGAGRREKPLRSAMLARLAWQTWRENRWTLLAAIAVGVLLVPAVELPLWFVRDQGARWLPPLPMSLLFVPALLGAMAFRADHRRGSYAFLDHKAARPRLTWLVRQAWWLTAAVATAAAVTAGLAIWGAWATPEVLTRQILGHWPVFNLDSPAADAIALNQTTAGIRQVAGLAWGGWLAAYGWGQLCSLTIRRDVLAGFVALLGAAAINATAWVMWAWDLRGAALLLPVGVATLAISWYVVPPFLAGRARWLDWLKPVATLGVGLAALGWAVPQARLQQVAATPPYAHLSAKQTRAARMPSEILAQWHNDGTAREVGRQYEQLLHDIVPDEFSALRQKQLPLFTPQEREAAEEFRQYLVKHAPPAPPETVGEGGYGFGGFGGEFGAGFGDEFGAGYGAPDSYEADEYLQQWTKDESLYWALQDAEQAAGEALDVSENNPAVAPWLRLLDEARTRRRALYFDVNQEVIERAIELSRQPRCLFADRMYAGLLADLLVDDARRLMHSGELDAAWQRIAALARWFAQSQQFRRSTQLRVDLAIGDSRGFAELFGDLVPDWAAAAGQTPERLRAAALDLLSAETIVPPFADSVVADYGHLWAIAALGEPPEPGDRRSQQPASRVETSRYWQEFLPLAAHQFSWERERAVRAAELLTADRLDFAVGVDEETIDAASLRRVAQVNRFWQPLTLAAAEKGEFGWPHVAKRQAAMDSAASSYLIADRWRRTESSFGQGLNGYLTLQSRRRANVLILLLAAYHLQHGEYPATLGEALAPMRNAEVPLLAGEGRATRPFTLFTLDDPFTREPLRYEPRGLDAPLAVNDAIAGAVSLPAGTPLLWSGGPCQLEPAKVEHDREPDTTDFAYPRPRYDNGKLQESEALRYEFRYSANAEVDGNARAPVVIPLPRFDTTPATKNSEADDSATPADAPQDTPHD